MCGYSECVTATGNDNRMPLERNAQLVGGTDDPGCQSAMLAGPDPGHYWKYREQSQKQSGQGKGVDSYHLLSTYSMPGAMPGLAVFSSELLAGTPFYRKGNPSQKEKMDPKQKPGTKRSPNYFEGKVAGVNCQQTFRNRSSLELWRLGLEDLHLSHSTLKANLPYEASAGVSYLKVAGKDTVLVWQTLRSEGERTGAYHRSL